MGGDSFQSKKHVSRKVSYFRPYNFRLVVHMKVDLHRSILLAPAKIYALWKIDHIRPARLDQRCSWQSVKETMDWMLDHEDS